MSKDHLQSLIQNLRLTAAPCEVQIQLPDFIHIPDEIALTYHDAYLLAPQLLDEGKITPEAMEKLEQLNVYFDQMSEDDRMWEIAALKDNEI